MAPSPETDNTPKAPDKPDKSKSQKDSARGVASEAAAVDIDKNLSVEKLDDDGLKALLDELATYRTPKDREGKSLLFKTLLTDAEDAIRKEHARSASGPELARYYNTSAKGRHRNKRQPSSISENLTHGGSLNDLAKEELYESVSYLQRPKKTVSARQREGGSLPCNVNAGASYDKQFFLEEQAKRKSTKEKPEYTSIDMMETDMLIENDSLSNVDFSDGRNDSSGLDYASRPIPNIYTSKATLQIGGNVDEGVVFPGMDRGERTLSSVAGPEEIHKYITETIPKVDLISMSQAIMHRKNLYEDKKMDENGNALGQTTVNDVKKRKKSRKVEGVMKAEDVEGHRGDIIQDIEKLLEYISGEEKKGAPKNKLQKHVSEDKGKQHKHRTRTSKSAKTSGMQKSNSLEEISSSKINDFNFDSDNKSIETPKLPLRSTKSNTERAARERKTWTTTSEQNASAENLESSDFTFVTKKKKSKKRRNSLGSKKQVYSNEVRPAEFHRVPSPRRKFACSVPHSEKSNDSSDTDSVHSLPVDSANNEQGNAPVSYADIAKCADKPKAIKPIEDKKGPLSPPIATPQSPSFKEAIVAFSPPKAPLEINNKADLNSLDNWPEIRNNKVNAVKNLESVQDWPSIHNNGLKPILSNDNKVKPPPVSVNKTKTINNSNSKSINKSPTKQEESIEVVGTPKAEPKLIGNQQLIQIPDQNQQNIMVYPYQLPPNIRDVQSIEKMQLKNLQANIGYVSNFVDEKPEETPVQLLPVIETCKRPAVVILSGADKHVSDITFGFDINEQLLNGDVCSDFTNRFFLPEVPKSSHFDKLINYIGSEWEETVVQLHSGKVKYFTDTL